MQTPDGISKLIESRWQIAAAAIILILFILFAYIILPLLDGIVLGIIFAYIARPTKNILDRYSPHLSPYIATTVIVVPLLIVLGLGTIEILNRVSWIIQNREQFTTALLSALSSFNIPEPFYSQLEDSIKHFSDSAIAFLGTLPLLEYLKGLALLLLNLLLSIIICFYLLSDGKRLVDKMEDACPVILRDNFKKFLVEFDSILSAIFIGSAYTSIIISMLSLAIFYIFGVPDPLVMTLLMFLAAIIPVIAGWMILIPLSVQRYFTNGPTDAAIFLLVSIAVIYIPPEIILRPYIIGLKSDIHPLLIILAFVGGGLAGGIAGFFISPVLLGALIAAYRVYVSSRDYTSRVGT